MDRHIAAMEARHGQHQDGIATCLIVQYNSVHSELTRAFSGISSSSDSQAHAVEAVAEKELASRKIRSFCCAPAPDQEGFRISYLGHEDSLLF